MHGTLRAKASGVWRPGLDLEDHLRPMPCARSRLARGGKGKRGAHGGPHATRPFTMLTMFWAARRSGRG